jgi:hypothetical protein
MPEIQSPERLSGYKEASVEILLFPSLLFYLHICLFQSGAILTLLYICMRVNNFITVLKDQLHLLHAPIGQSIRPYGFKTVNLVELTNQDQRFSIKHSTQSQGYR